MATRDDIFEVRIGRMGRASEFASEFGRLGGRIGGANPGAPIQGPMQGVIGRAKRAGSGAAKTAKSFGLRAHFRKGGAKPAHGFSGSQRRVVVKARIVAHGAGKAAPLKTHVAYLAREGRANARGAPSELERAASPEATPELSRQVDYLARDGAEDRGLYVFYDGAREGVDAKAIRANWANDTRHFRLIISAEDGAALGDMKPFVREVMGDLETKLGTRLEWAAVDHWDTDNPHTHVLIRGRRADGTDLVIPRKIISHGIREHAQQVATRVLGPRPALSGPRQLS